MNEIIEEWKSVVGYEGIYEVSNLGKVKSLKNNHGDYREKILRQRKDKDGYLKVVLYKEKNVKPRSYRVHRLVASAFLENPNGYNYINHIDENKTNNLVSNLEWCSVAYNNMYGSRIKKVSEKLTNGVRSKRVYQYSLDGSLVGIWESTRECGRQGFDQRHISDCCRGKAKSHKGFKWSYTEIKKEQG